ncbi:response regulator transcription factor [Actinoplanes rectilineatus]|uniref:response regulator transcription factor n=1 Tax=Actinoplanes rectilineatus TaxID=113571 RepID=UPI0005F2B6D2|nr:response regulator [Actinoplanes rectilineatus]
MTSVLVVDDDPTILQIVETVLRSGGLDVATRTCGRDGLRAAHEQPPDCAVLDVTMPDMTGLEVCRALRDDAETANIPIILLTGRGQWLDVASGFDAGADDYLVKPFTAQDLLTRVAALTARGHQARS